MAEAVKRRYDNSRRLAQVRATRAKVIDAAKQLFIKHGYPATTLEAVADAADVALPTLYRLFGSKRALLKEVLDTSPGATTSRSPSETDPNNNKRWPSRTRPPWCALSPESVGC